MKKHLRYILNIVVLAVLPLIYNNCSGFENHSKANLASLSDREALLSLNQHYFVQDDLLFYANPQKYKVGDQFIWDYLPTTGQTCIETASEYKYALNIKCDKPGEVRIELAVITSTDFRLLIDSLVVTVVSKSETDLLLTEQQIYPNGKDLSGLFDQSPVINDPGLDPLIMGKTLYTQTCARCHGELPNSAKRGRTATQIMNAIRSVPAMAQIQLTSEQINEIAKALSL